MLPVSGRQCAGHTPAASAPPVRAARRLPRVSCRLVRFQRIIRGLDDFARSVPILLSLLFRRLGRLTLTRGVETEPRGPAGREQKGQHRVLESLPKPPLLLRALALLLCALLE